MKAFLLIDDDAFSREHIGKLVSRKGFKVLSAGTGLKGIDLYKEHKPSCVFLDIRLPDIDGVQVLEKIRAVDPTAVVYFITGSDDVINAEQAKKLGVRGYINKPVMLDQLIEVLKEIE